MCPCEAASKTSATREKHASITHASQRRGKSVSDGFSRASLRVFAVTLLAVLRAAPASHQPLKASLASALSTGAQHPHLFQLFYLQKAKNKIFLLFLKLGTFWAVLLG